MKYYVPVESVDTSVPVTSAQFGSYWSGQKWVEAEENTGFYNVLKRSYAAMRKSMNPRRDVWDPWARNRRFDWEQAFREHNPDADCWGDEIPGPPRYASDVPDWLPKGIL
jgi:hypothetical protein